MPQKNGPRKHHYIPEFYLRQWAGDDGRFERYNRPIPTKIMVRRSFPSEAGWIEDLYTSPADPNGTHWLEESIFQVVDSRAAKALRKMNAEHTEPLSAADRSAWTVFILSLFHRTPENFQATVTTAMEIYNESLEKSRDKYMEIREKSDPETFDEFKILISDEKKEDLHYQQSPPF